MVLETEGAPFVEVMVVATRGPADIDDAALVNGYVLERALRVAPSPTSARALEDDAAALGGTFDVQVEAEHARVGVRALAPALADTVSVVIEHALRPSLSDAALAEARTLAVDDATKDARSSLFAADRSLYGDASPLGRPELGRIDQMGSASRSAIAGLHARLFDRRNIVVVISGGANKRAALAAIEAATAKLPPTSGAALPVKSSVASPSTEAITVVDVRGATHTTAFLTARVPATPGMSRATSIAALEIIGSHLALRGAPQGGGSSSDVVSFRDHDRLVVALWGSRDAVTTKLKMLLPELGRAREHDLPDAELARSRLRVRTDLERHLMRPTDVATYAAVGLSRDANGASSLAAIADAADNLSAADVRKMAAAGLPTSALRLVVQGDHDALTGDLVALGLGTPRRRGLGGSALAQTVPPSSETTSLAATGQPSSAPPASAPPAAAPPAFAASPQSSDEDRRAREERDARDERLQQRRRDEAAEERRLQAEAERERQEADRRFQDQLRQLQDDMQRQLQGQGKQTAATMTRIREQQDRARQQAERQRDEARRRADDREAERQRQKADRELRERQERELEERRERERREAARRAADEARQKNEDMRRKFEEQRKQLEEQQRKIAEENRRIQERARGDGKSSPPKPAAGTCGGKVCNPDQRCCPLPPKGEMRCVPGGKGSACAAI